MGNSFAAIVAELLEWYLDIKFWLKKKKRRKFEGDNNLPKKQMIHPMDGMIIIVIIVGIICVISFSLFVSPNIKENSTKEKLDVIVGILNQEKKVLGTYPETLKIIIRNNPLRQNIIKDAWGNNFEYQLSEDGESYILFSIGKDNISNTEDDIFTSNLK